MTIFVSQMINHKLGLLQSISQRICWIRLHLPSNSKIK